MESLHKSSWQTHNLKHSAATVLYVFVSISTTFFNKAVLSVYNFQYTNFILLAQHLFTIAVLESFKAIGLIDYPSPEIKKCKELLPISLMYSLNVGVALSALSSLNIPMYGVLKRFTILLTLIGESIFMKKYSSTNVKKSVALIILGAVVAGLGDLSFDLLAYFLALVSCVAQTAYLIAVAKTGAETGTNSFGLLFYNSLLAIPFVLVLVIYNQEFQSVLDFPGLTNFDFQACFLSNLLLGALLNYSMFLCTTTNSALTTAIAGQLKNIVSIFFGLFLLGGMETNFVNILGLILNSIGAVAYSVVKYNEGKSKGEAAQGKTAALPPSTANTSTPDLNLSSTKEANIASG